jgi:hypothetical protein
MGSAPLQGFTRTSLARWRRKRCAVARSKWTGAEANPPFIVTSFDCDTTSGGQIFHEDVYCARGDMENRVRDWQTNLLVGRPCSDGHHAPTSSRCGPPLTYVLVCTLRRLGLARAELVEPHLRQIRLKFLSRP